MRPPIDPILKASQRKANKNKEREAELFSTLHIHLMGAGLPDPEVEYSAIPGRKFRFDMAWPDQLIAVEIEGGTFVTSRHRTSDGFTKDLDKYNLAAVNGWRVLRVSPEMIESGAALQMIEAVFAYVG
jgi:hypothetical protein